MREIKFRGRKEGSRVWDYGGYSKQGDKAFITSIGEDRISYITYLREVAPKTLGQYTGLKDKNGVEIYEGDIVKVSNFNFSAEIGKVEWNSEVACFRIVGHLFDDSMGIHREDIEVIGNIYDNPELLEVEE